MIDGRPKCLEEGPSAGLLPGGLHRRMRGDFHGDDGSVADVLLRDHRLFLASLVPMVTGAEYHVRAVTHVTEDAHHGNRNRALPVGVDGWRLGALEPGGGRVTLS